MMMMVAVAVGPMAGAGRLPALWLPPLLWAAQRR